MNVQRDPDPILAAWLHEGPTRLPDATRRAIAVSIRTTRQTRLPSWLPWRAPTLTGMTRYALAAVAVVAVVVGGLYLLKPGSSQPGGVGGPGSPVPSVSPKPSASPTPSPPVRAEPSVGPLTQAFTSPTFGYSMRYPAGWTVTATTDGGPTPAGSDDFVSAAGGWYFRASSVPIPDGVVVDDWIPQVLQKADDPGCMPPRNTQESVVIGGHEGRILGFCGVLPAPQIEATVVLGKRAYLFTLFDSQDVPNEAEARALFDRIQATITLDPARAVRSSPKPSSS